MAQRPPGLISEVEERASENDRLWFERHPERNYRVRLNVPGELGTTTSTDILVVQIYTGFRIRHPLGSIGHIANDDAILEHAADVMIAPQLALKLGLSEDTHDELRNGFIAVTPEMHGLMTRVRQALCEQRPVK